MQIGTINLTSCKLKCYQKKKNIAQALSLAGSFKDILAKITSSICVRSYSTEPNFFFFAKIDRIFFFNNMVLQENTVSTF